MNKKVAISVGIIIVIIVGYIILQNQNNERANDSTIEVTETNLEGLHIMSDGTVMSGSGQVFENAQAIANGTVKLGNGDVIEGVMDMRAGDSVEGMESMDQ